MMTRRRLIVHRGDRVDPDAKIATPLTDVEFGDAEQWLLTAMIVATGILHELAPPSKESDLASRITAYRLDLRP
jgi:hypothetical protein